ncbi:NUDIX hydrolase [Polaromonas naphthalenivorans]|uniref:NUDIX hydrolase n=1 Tax=Polaromonas naphthalenivorans (strain CJ2) TaxID=365044 RepID=A1VQS3_POLNA|nr:NUDIX hydrolase [Polaromonas naphthalenivorans]ABM38001.1 NUDIX hydrolase [Polaromonas naphthalenivorans CJ2]
MELNLEIVTTPLRPAATVVMLRDAPTGLEVFLMKRHALSDVLGGAYVFPGGKVDALDAELDMAAHLDQPLPVLHAGLNETDISERTAGGLYVAALREAFEESGVLFAQGLGAQDIDTARAAALLREGQGFNAVLARMGLRLQTRSLVPWSRWITPTSPSVMNKRFDTRFFVSAVPAGQVAVHDNHETTESVWLSPRTALQQYWAGQIALAPPQIMSLAHLSRHASVDSVMTQARGRMPPVIQPEPFDLEGGRVICYPGDARHPVSEPAMPGPTRLYYRNKRFEPGDGFESLFSD